jgi:hypothetical protein
MKIINYLVFTIAIFCVLTFFVTAQTNAAVNLIIKNPTINQTQGLNDNCRPRPNLTSYPVGSNDYFSLWN